MGRYNELIQEANDLMSTVHDEQESFFDARSTAYQDGNAGQNYQIWTDEWSEGLDELDELDFPDPMEEPELDAAHMLMDLPDMP